MSGTSEENKSMEWTVSLWTTWPHVPTAIMITYWQTHRNKNILVFWRIPRLLFTLSTTVLSVQDLIIYCVYCCNEVGIALICKTYPIHTEQKSWGPWIFWGISKNIHDPKLFLFIIHNITRETFFCFLSNALINLIHWWTCVSRYPAFWSNWVPISKA